MSELTPPAGWWPLIGILLVAGVLLLAADYWPEKRDPMRRYIDDLARANRRYERSSR